MYKQVGAGAISRNNIIIIFILLKNKNISQ